MEHFTSQEDEPYRQCWYRYHREGLDRLESKREEAHSTLLQVVKELSELHRSHPRTIALTDWEQTKLPELVQLFRSAPEAERRRLSEYLRQLFPTEEARLRTLQ